MPGVEAANIPDGPGVPDTSDGVYGGSCRGLITDGMY
jgi:hypothetical protein